MLSFYIRALRSGADHIKYHRICVVRRSHVAALCCGRLVGMWALQALHVARGGESHRSHSHATTPRHEAAAGARRRPGHEKPSGSLRPQAARQALRRQARRSSPRSAAVGRPEKNRCRLLGHMRRDCSGLPPSRHGLVHHARRL